MTSVDDLARHMRECNALLQLRIGFMVGNEKRRPWHCTCVIATCVPASNSRRRNRISSFKRLCGSSTTTADGSSFQGFSEMASLLNTIYLDEDDHFEALEFRLCMFR